MRLRNEIYICFVFYSGRAQAAVERVFEKVSTENEKSAKAKATEDYISANISHDIQSGEMIFSGIEDLR